ncbi:retrovirus-related pol polyprotein from transposon TNT 1-94 [Tanacetum coccineum]
MEETFHVSFSEDDEAIYQTSTEGDAINFNENRSFPDDEFVEPRTKDTQCSVNIEYFPYVSAYENITSAVLSTLQNSVTSEEPLEFTIADDLAAIHEPYHDESADNLESAEPQVILQNPVPQDRWSREKHIELVNIIGEPLANITTRSRIIDSDAASAHECLYVSFLSEIEPKKLIEAQEKEGWVIAMQEELNQFERNKVWTLVPKPHGKTIIGTKWIWKNKMDEEGVVPKNKARLVAQGYNQQEWIDYEETFFTYCKTGGYQNLSFLCSLHGFCGISNGCEECISECEMPCASPNNFGPDESGVSVNKTLFRGMIGSLMYLTASRPDIQFSTCLCARYQANPKESHLVTVKRIFRYLNETPNLGLWYLKGSGFDLKAYSDSGYAGCNLDRKSTSGGCQILEGKLVCWSAKKQSSVAMSSAEAEYVAAAGCCA